MNKIVTIILVTLIIVSCTDNKPKKYINVVDIKRSTNTEGITNTDNSENNSSVVFSDVYNIIRCYDEGVIKNINPNNDIVEMYFNKPINNKNIYVDDCNYYKDLRTLLDELDLKVQDKYYNTESHENIDSMQINNSVINLCLIIGMSSKTVRLFKLEYRTDSDKYDYKLKINESKNSVISKLGDPAFYNENILIYNSNKSNKQLNIYIKNDVVDYIQYIAWEGE